MRMISGCPSQPMKTLAWRRDTWADQRGVDEAGCQRRKSVWDKFCRAEDAEMLYVGGRAGFAPELTAEALQASTYQPPLPAQPRTGADSDIPMVASPRTYPDVPVAEAPQAPIRSPRGPAQSSVSADADIPVAASPRSSPDAPVDEAPQAPTYQPPLPAQPHTGVDSDFPVAASPRSSSDVPVAQGEDEEEEEEEEEEAPPPLPPPMVAPPQTYSDVSVTRVPQTPAGSPPVPIQSRSSAGSGIPMVASPKTHSDVPVAQSPKTFPGHDSDVLKGYPSRSEPGCYYRTPSGCPARPMKTRMWRHDLYAEQHQVDEAGCKERKRVWDKHCEVDDVKVLFVPR
jgi:hypothetical protein